ncbi:Histone-lysine N-methyltransferase, H3 lysine-36 specific [Yarrowia sp. C11]|nr:Histone-lysine N-methyltransferase, H3 lysine-36 specific [Yarrowia sp. C11]KAG5370740.1 Histone-lysine N-methyltransferase, H3 lysine-36 specific [Yarrowia sp. E02]
MSGNNSPINVQLFPDAPDVTSDALKTFVELPECTYMKGLGSSQQAEVMACDCKPGPSACDEDSGCINRLTSIECVRCCKGCQNKRFQGKKYASVDVISTEKKGFGLRATKDIAAGEFVYEYVGEVIDEPTFKDRTAVYMTQGVKHFYFMMLQKGEFIDATAKGGLGRFCNHSCAPNGHVEKWVVGKRLRMGIFASRHIQKGEEVTFDYNVDRYGAEAQACYCGEKNCVGFLGGKTQTESAGKVSGTLTAALGLTSRDINAIIRGKKSPEDVQPRDLTVEDVSKVMASLMMNQEAWQVLLMLQRIALATDTSVQAAVMKMHGYQIFAQILTATWGDNPIGLDQRDRINVTLMLLRVLQKWPRITKNKISSSQIENVVKNLSSNDNVDIATIAQELLSEWANLKMAFRIPRRKIDPEGDDRSVSRGTSEEVHNKEPSEEVEVIRVSKKVPDNTSNGAATTAAVAAVSTDSPSTRSESPFTFIPTPYSNKTAPKGPKKASKQQPASPNVPPRRLPQGWQFANDTQGKVYYYNLELDIQQWEFPKASRADSPSTPKAPKHPKGARGNRRDERRDNSEPRESMSLQSQRESDLQRIIEQARQQEVNQASSGSKPATPVKPVNTQAHRLTKLLAKVVPNQVSKYDVDRERAKKCSKDIVQILVDKELKRPEPMTEISDDKAKKVKEFVKGYMSKVVRRLEEKEGKAGSSSSSRRGRKRQSDAGDHSGNPARKRRGEENQEFGDGPMYDDENAETSTTTTTTTTETAKKPRVDMEIDLE